MRLGGRLNDFQKLLALRDSIVISGQNANVHIETARGFLRGNCLLDLIVVRVVRERYEESQALHGNALTRIIARLVITRQVTMVTGAGNAIFVGCWAYPRRSGNHEGHEGTRRNTGSFTFGILRVLVLRVRRLVSKKEGASRYSGRLTVSDELFGEDQVSGASDGTLPE